MTCTPYQHFKIVKLSLPQVKHDVLSSGIQYHFHNHHQGFVASHQNGQSEN